MDLSLVTSEQLANELLKRFDVALVALVRTRTTNGTAEQNEIATAWKGGPLKCIGVAAVLERRLVEAFLAEQNPTSG